VLDIGIDAGGAPWMMAGTGVFFWNGERFVQVRTPSFSRKLCDWAEGMLTIYARSAWHRVDLTGPIHDAHVLDAGDDLYFLASDQLHHIDEHNRFSACPVKWPDGSEGRRRITLSGTSQALMLQYGHPGLHRLGLSSGEIEEATALNTKLGTRKLLVLLLFLWIQSEPGKACGRCWDIIQGEKNTRNMEPIKRKASMIRKHFDGVVA
jgi:hypothetical protein